MVWKDLLSRGLQRRWQRLRPLPKPDYISGTPVVADSAPPNVYQIPNTLTLAAAALSEEAMDFVIELLGMLAPSEETTGQQAWYRLCKAQFGHYWRFADLTTTLWAAASLIRPASYLEIGVRRGRSAAVVAASCPDCEIVGFDLWVDEYAGVVNPGPEFVRRELSKTGHRGSVTLVSGNSRETVPAYLREHPDAFFDLITVDGDHSVQGASIDLANVLPRLKVGGIVLFDDISIVYALRRVWDQIVKRDSRYLTWEYADSGFGIAVAVRVGDEPLISTLRRR